MRTGGGGGGPTKVPGPLTEARLALCSSTKSHEPAAEQNSARTCTPTQQQKRYLTDRDVLCKLCQGCSESLPGVCFFGSLRESIRDYNRRATFWPEQASISRSGVVLVDEHRNLQHLQLLTLSQRSGGTSRGCCGQRWIGKLLSRAEALCSLAPCEKSSFKQSARVCALKLVGGLVPACS